MLQFFTYVSFHLFCNVNYAENVINKRCVSYFDATLTCHIVFNPLYFSAMYRYYEYNNKKRCHFERFIRKYSFLENLCCVTKVISNYFRSASMIVTHGSGATFRQRRTCYVSYESTKHTQNILIQETLHIILIKFSSSFNIIFVN